MKRTLRILLLLTGMALCTPAPGQQRDDQGVTADHGVPPAMLPVSLSAEERAWLEAHPTIRVHLMSWPPFKIDDQVPPRGLTIDYLDLIGGALGLQIEYVQATWSEALRMARERKGIDVLPLLTNLPERREFLQFTREYVSFPIVIFTRRDGMFIGGMDDLRQARVAVERDFAMHYRLKRDIGADRIKVVDTTTKALLALAGGQVDAYVGNLAVGSYLIQARGMSNLKVAAPAPYGTHDQAIGVRSDWPMLARLMDRALGAITERGHFEIRQRWLGVRYEHGLTPGQFWSRVAGITGAALVVVLGVFLWNRRLKREVEERRAVEAALKESRARLVEAQELAHIGAWTWEPGARHIECSDEMCRILGLAAGCGRVTLDRVRASLDDSDRAALDARWVAWVKEGTPLQGEAWLAAEDGARRFVVYRGAPAEPARGQPAKMVGTCQDITERKRREEERARFDEQMRETQKLETLGVLAGGIAHDFNNLLAAIMGNAEMTLLDLPPQKTEARESIKEVIRASNRAADLCAQMLAYAGRATMVMEPVDVGVLVRDMLRILRVSMSKKAELHLDFPESIPAVHADPAQLQQVVMNLITNASEALGDEPGEIRVSLGVTRREDLPGDLAPLGHELGPGPLVYLSVADTGKGMDEETRARVFEPFFSTKFAGRGLGMAALLGIMRSHKGAVTVRSSPAVGSTFTLLWPATDRKPRRSGYVPVVTPRTDRRSTGLVLLVDDEEMIRHTAETILARLGFDVVTATGGLEAVEVFEQHAGDLRCVILDLTMPDLDGDETFRRLHRIDPTVPVVVASGHSQADVEERFQPPGPRPAGFICKPFGIDTLVTSLNAAISDR